MKPIRIITVGLQGGDEGKGKAVDELITLAKERDDRPNLVARFQGGTNAGHTLKIPTEDGTIKFVTHAAPSGIAHNTDIAIGPHTAFDTEQFAKELSQAEDVFGYDGRVLISENVGVLFPYHKLLDGWREEERTNKIGTTKSGIGPFYEFNSNRTNRIRFTEYVSDNFHDKLNKVIKDHVELNHFADKKNFNLDEMVEEILAVHDPIRKEMKGFEEALFYRMRDYMKNGANIIVEGAQGTLLDVDWGENQYVTSSHLLGTDAIGRLGLTRDFKILGIEKIYPTRVGAGSMPTYDKEFTEQHRENLGEEGATTGRPRRLGHPDWAMIRKTAGLSDCDGIILTRADCVQNVDLKVGVGYKVEGNSTDELPGDMSKVESVIYNSKTYRWSLWQGKWDYSDEGDDDKVLDAHRDAFKEGGFENIPVGLDEYIRDHDEYVGVPIRAVAFGPRRGDILHRDLLD